MLTNKTATFGDYTQVVLSILAEDYGWDDPYASLSPTYDPLATKLDLIFDTFYVGANTDECANRLNKLLTE